MIFAVLFRPEDQDCARFTLNPLAPAFGGPAWDFMWTVPNPTAGKEYVLSFRGLFKPFINRDDALNEYNSYVLRI